MSTFPPGRSVGAGRREGLVSVRRGAPVRESKVPTGKTVFLLTEVTLPPRFYVGSQSDRGVPLSTPV